MGPPTLQDMLFGLLSTWFCGKAEIFVLKYLNNMLIHNLKKCGRPPFVGGPRARPTQPMPKNGPDGFHGKGPPDS